MYRDDQCAVCGEALPPDHLYCREHAAGVDDRLRRIGGLLDRIAGDVPDLALLLSQVAQETYDWLTDLADEDDDWPPAFELTLRLSPDDVRVDVDDEPGLVRVSVRSGLHDTLAALGGALQQAGQRRFAKACGEAEGANATH